MLFYHFDEFKLQFGQNAWSTLDKHWIIKDTKTDQKSIKHGFRKRINVWDVLRTKPV